jgi:hypothetical protein
MGVNKIAAGLTGLVLALGAAAGMAAGSFQVELRTPRWVDLTVTQAEHLRDGAIELVESATLNSLDDAEVLRQTPADLRRRLQALITGPHLVVTLDEPRPLQSLNEGGTQIVQILIGFGRSTTQTSGGVFTVDNRGQLYVHENCSGDLIAELFGFAGSLAGKNSARSYAF